MKEKSEDFERRRKKNERNREFRKGTRQSSTPFYSSDSYRRKTLSNYCRPHHLCTKETHHRRVRNDSETDIRMIDSAPASLRHSPLFQAGLRANYSPAQHYTSDHTFGMSLLLLLFSSNEGFVGLREVDPDPRLLLLLFFSRATVRVREKLLVGRQTNRIWQFSPSLRRTNQSVSTLRQYVSRCLSIAINIGVEQPTGPVASHSVRCSSAGHRAHRR